MHRRGKGFHEKHLANVLHSLRHSFTQLLSKYHFPPSPGLEVIDSASWNNLPRHLFQAESLGTDLEIVMLLGSFGAMLVFHGKRNITMKLDDIGFSHQPQTFAPQR